MEIIQIVGLGLLATILIILVREKEPEFALQLSLVVSILIFGLMLTKIIAIIDFLRNLALKANINLIYLDTILKVIGIAYIAEFGAAICRDAGEGVIASKIEFAGKVLIMVLAIPVMLAILESVMQLLP
ncbi:MULTISPECIES: stage III sporulation protein AD [unclassified Candidatus Frackibacter]|uniref:stage III sporulation protein AD n=1 Tax=unclassified Candidatus Frackibacter TaxID=2648818 RepID=UPI000795D534|nr:MULTISPECIES: stage III sporulation protein AD [unclassified Candidatus Frackibacter]KXS45947.1 MAG: stage III sporulation protein AD [Candidatus Frackibacter sp. T328-2]SDC03114.1 stage III sporulation protein AD [Candidatus Frackibacter sp. WG11]SEM69254.1 stage III sporulation protein AD [Candidatus Frackibacter sp. WG12]SFL80531.1 stage III sporulation protein AD [Candidatus Frackibacter sp. WG13]